MSPSVEALLKEHVLSHEDIKEIWRTSEIGRHVRAEDGDQWWSVAIGVVGESSTGYHARIEVHYQHDDFNQAGTYNGRITRQEPEAWNGPFATAKEASREVKKSLVAFDRKWAEIAGEDRKAGTHSYAYVNQLMKFEEKIDEYLGIRRRAEAAIVEIREREARGGGEMRQEASVKRYGG